MPVFKKPDKLIVFDCDTTLVRQEIIDEMARLAGKYDEVAALTKAAMEGNADFSSALRKKVGAVKGLSLKKIKKMAEEKVELRANAAKTIAELKKRGFYVAVVSGSFHQVVDSLRAKLPGIDSIHCNHLGVENGVLNGEVEIFVGGPDGKGLVVKRLQQQLGIRKEKTASVGDGATDIAMFRESAISIAFNAKPKTKAAATFSIDGDDLSQILPRVASL